MNTKHNLDELADAYLKLFQVTVPYTETDILLILNTVIDKKTFFSLPKTFGEPALERLNKTLEIFETELTEKEKKQLKPKILRVLKKEIHRMEIDRKQRKDAKTSVDEDYKKFSNRQEHEIIIDQLVTELNDLDEIQLEAGLGVILRSTQLYLMKNPTPDSKIFQELIEAVIAEEQKKKSPRDHRLTYIDPLAPPIPLDIVASIVSGERDVSSLKDSRIRHEWTVEPARKFLKRFSKELKRNICLEEGIYGKFKKYDINKIDLPTIIASSILTWSFAPAAFWCPIAAYVGLLIARTGLNTFCNRKYSKP